MVSDVSDEFVPGIQDVETQNRLAITLNQRAAIRPKPSIHFTYVCSQATTVVDDEVDNDNVPPVVPPGHNSVLGLKFTDPTHLEDELVSELSFTPEVTSTQRCEESTDSPTDSSKGRGNHSTQRQAEPPGSEPVRLMAKGYAESGRGGGNTSTRNSACTH